MNGNLIFILAVIILKFGLNLIVEILNLKNLQTVLPDEFAGYYDAEKYKRAQEYLKVKTRFYLLEDTVMVLLTIVFILLGGFNIVDTFARGLVSGEILHGLIFLGILLLASQLVSLPFSIYNTFVIEERFGFNKTTARTFVLDLIKGWLITALIAGITFSAVIWFFLKTGDTAWLWCWLAVVLFELFLMFIAPVWIMPLFNKFVPLEEGELKTAINDYAGSQNFKLQGIFKIDASRRSTKSNAFFTGFGRFRRIALFDTLIEKHTTEELVSVLAHEIGHYKKRHVLKMLAISVLTTGLMFFILSFFLNNQGLFAAFSMARTSVYASLVFFGFLYSPINMIFSVLSQILSRKHEYEADRFAISTYKHPEAFITALKKLTVDNLSNLTPHPLKVFLGYSHPPVLKRIEAIRDYRS